MHNQNFYKPNIIKVENIQASSHMVRLTSWINQYLWYQYYCDQMHKQKIVLTEIDQNFSMIWPTVPYKPTCCINEDCHGALQPQSWQTQILIVADIV